jgi:hypothetical protein
MKVTVDQILEREEHLEREILECQCHLAAIRVLRAHLKNKPATKWVELGTLASVVAAPTPTALPKEAIELFLENSTPTPAPLSAPPRVERYMHPELKAIGTRFGCTSEAVYWAVQRMTADYTVRDILALLRREGYRITSAQASTVLLRMRDRKEIEQDRSSREPLCVFRKPEAVLPPESEAGMLVDAAASIAESVTAA